MIMLDNFSNFMVFGLKDTGEREKINITEQEFSQNNGHKILHDSQVVIIIKEELRRIYIWKGYQSNVRKKFIASRVAQALQKRLIDIANFHRCKIVSIDQGEEPQEFLNAFGFKSYEIPKKKEINQPSFSRVSNCIIGKVAQIPKSSSNSRDKNIKTIKNLNPILNKSREEILNNIIHTQPSNGYKRNHILIGNNILYGIVTKKTEIFGKPIEESVWEPFEKLPKEIFELNGHKLRIHFNKNSNSIEAIEVLEKISEIKKEEKSELKVNYNKWTVKQLKSFCVRNDIKVPSSYRKAQIVSLVEEFNKS